MESDDLTLDELQVHGNCALFLKDYEDAIGKFTSALDIRDEVIDNTRMVSLLCNRADAQYQLSQKAGISKSEREHLLQSSLGDGQSTIKLDPSHRMGYYR